MPYKDKNSQVYKDYKTRNTEKVKNWRRNFKSKLVQAMGGCCQICGYNKSNSAMECHHIDPSEKEFSFGGVRANPKAVAKMIPELKKCILLCANCHREVHEGITDIPFEHASLNEEILLRPKSKPKKEILKKEKIDRRKIILTDEEFLATLEKHKHNKSSVARLLGVSETAIRKRINKINMASSSSC